MTTPAASTALPGQAWIRVRRRIEWADTDASGHWYHATVFRLLEAAEARLFARLGLSQLVVGRLPRVRIGATFSEVLRYDDLVECILRVERVGHSSIDLALEVRRDDTRSAQATARAVLLDVPFGRPLPWPADAHQLLLSSGEVSPEGG